MRLLVAHNAYRHPGGEDAVVANEVAALRAAGIQVDTFIVPSGPRAAWHAVQAPFGQGAQAALEDELKRRQPDILHVHNLFPIWSPRVFHLARALGIRTVQTLHNFRPLCLNGLFLTPAHDVCERCAVAGHHMPGVVRGCYRESRLQSLGLAAHLGRARQERWYDHVDRFVAPSEFLRDRYVHYGFPAERFFVQGHAMADSASTPVQSPGDYILYLGRLSEEKGVRWLVQTFRRHSRGPRLIVAGDGPLRRWCDSQRTDRITLAGFVQGPEKQPLIASALAVVMPSLCYENFPMAVPEANACGVPALVAGHGGLASIVVPGMNGEHFIPSDTTSFIQALSRMESSWSDIGRREACREYAKDRFSKTTFMNHRLAFYDKLLSAPEMAERSPRAPL